MAFTPGPVGAARSPATAAAPPPDAKVDANQLLKSEPQHQLRAKLRPCLQPTQSLLLNPLDETDLSNLRDVDTCLSESMSHFEDK